MFVIKNCGQCGCEIHFSVDRPSNIPLSVICNNCDGKQFVMGQHRKTTVVYMCGHTGKVYYGSREHGDAPGLWCPDCSAQCVSTSWRPPTRQLKRGDILEIDAPEPLRIMMRRVDDSDVYGIICDAFDRPNGNGITLEWREIWEMNGRVIPVKETPKET